MTNRAIEQLHTHASERFRVFSNLAADDSLLGRAAGFLPMIRWPNGRWCLEGNLFLNRLLDKGSSLKGKGGTLTTYCSYLAPLLRFCFFAKKQPSELADVDFKFVLSTLGSIDKKKGRPRNNRTTMVKIGSVWLEFLSFVGSYYGNSHFLSHTESNANEGIGVIKGFKKKHEGKLPNGHIYCYETWHHPSFPTERDPEGKRFPLSEMDVAKLREAADDAQCTHFIRQRRLATIELFDILGFRRMEAVLLTVGDVEAAIKTDEEARNRGDVEFVPSITFRSVKKKGNKTHKRTVPINRISLDFLTSYNELRKRHLKELGVKESPASAFLVRESNGQALQPNWLTQEFHFLARKAGLMGPCSPHMMRHRFITQAFVTLIISHKINSVDEFHEMLRKRSFIGVLAFACLSGEYVST
jgi:site-specific recombinase XerC